jgi:MYXO-CTERM domain-containing protein
LGFGHSALAYSTKTVVSDGCHEEITQSAVHRTRAELGPVDALTPTRDERALIDDLPFELASDLRDLGAATLVLGNHYVDFRGNEPDDLDQLAPLHGDPGHQREHCLRSDTQDDTAGSKAALAECRAVIREKIEAALAGLADDGSVDPTRRTRLRVALDLRGPVDADLPTFHVELGQALHTIQDGFSHTFRTADHLEVVTVLNYVEFVEDRLDTAVDGPAHRSLLDECHGLDTLRQERLEVATTASAEFLQVALDPELEPATKLARTDALLDKYFTQKDGCDASNHWCDAPEEAYRDPAAGCQCASAAPGGFRPGPLGLVVLAALGLWRRRVAQCRRIGPGLLLAIGLAFGLRTTTAHAQADDANSAEPPVTDPVARAAVATEDARIEQDPPMPLGVALDVAASFENPAAAVALGGRYRFSEHWLVGLDAEYNPWYADQTGEFRQGVASLYGSVIVRFPMRFERINLRSTLQLGASRMLFDLYGVPKGTTGPFVGLNILGLDYELGRQLYLVVNPAHIALPIPQTTGAPFSYVQYRLTLGLQWGA